MIFGRARRRSVQPTVAFAGSIRCQGVPARLKGVAASVLLVAALAGCANEQTAKLSSSPGAIRELPAFQSPGSIRPSDESLAVKPMSAGVAATPPGAVALPIASRGSGPWAPPVAPRPWRYIVLHHSASPSGNAAVFDREHRDKGWDELGYHFVIDNGQGGPDGRIEIGPRWVKQKWGAHAKTPDQKYNNFGIGICFVGNFENSRPTQRQLASAASLVAWLETTYQIPEGNVIGHEDTGKQTLCPGKNLHVAQVRSLADAQIAAADSGQILDTPMTTIFEPSRAAQAIHARVAVAPTQVELMQAR